MVRRRKKIKPRAPKPELSMQEMLSRIPDRDWINTKEVQHVMSDCHKVSVYRYVQQGRLTPHPLGGKKANRYPRSEVVALVRSKFIPRSESETENDAKSKAKTSNQAKKTKET